MSSNLFLSYRESASILEEVARVLGLEINSTDEIRLDEPIERQDVASTICVVVYDYDFYGYDEPNPDMHHQIFTERLDEYAFVTKLKLVVVEEGDISFSVRKYNEIYGWADIIETYSLI